MKKLILLIIIFTGVGLSAQEIGWMSLQEAEVQMKKTPEKPLFIDFYTDWCGWCKTMDNSTFKDPEVVSYINENYIPVKFDAESKEEVTFRGKNYKYAKPQGGGYRGINSFAYFSLRGNLSYPSYAVINSNGRLERLLMGYMAKDKLFDGLKQ